MHLGPRCADTEAALCRRNPDGGKILMSWTRFTSKVPFVYLQDDTFVQQTLLLGRHHKVMCVVFIIHYVLQVDT